MRNYRSPRTYRDFSQQRFTSRSPWKEYVIPVALAIGGGIVALTGCTEASELEKKVLEEPAPIVQYEQIPTQEPNALYATGYWAE